MATSVLDIWRGNPWWAKVLLAVAVVLFLLEAAGVVDELGLAALNLTAIAFLFSMNRAVGEMTSALEGTNARLAGMGSTLEGMNSTLVGMNSTLEGVSSTLDGMNSTLDGMKATLERIERRV